MYDSGRKTFSMIIRLIQKSPVFLTIVNSYKFASSVLNHQSILLLSCINMAAKYIIKMPKKKSTKVKMKKINQSQNENVNIKVV